MSKTKKYSYLFLIPLLLILFNPINFCFAQGVSPELLDKMDAMDEAFRSEAGFEDSTQATLGGTIATLIKAFLGLLGMIFIILMLLAGYNWMTAGGEEEKVNKAKETIKRAIIGLIIIAAAYSITYFVFTFLPWGGGSNAGGGGAAI
jgi:amino acid transporter